jgi:NTP pyrophosphatase (non-canonical NTP hydrolase)
MNRPEITPTELNAAFAYVKEKMDRRIQKYGWGSYASAHEALGKLMEEFNELQQAIQKKDSVEIWMEFADVAIPCIFAIAGLHNKKMDVN